MNDSQGPSLWARSHRDNIPLIALTFHPFLDDLMSTLGKEKILLGGNERHSLLSGFWLDRLIFVTWLVISLGLIFYRKIFIHSCIHMASSHHCVSLELRLFATAQLCADRSIKNKKRNIHAQSKTENSKNTNSFALNWYISLYWAWWNM